MFYYDADSFSVELIAQKKQTRKIAVVFSTFGEREADLVHEKITLYVSALGGLIDKIVLSHRRSGNSPDRTEVAARNAYEKTDILVCNDYEVPDMGNEKGKGADMRRAVYHLVKECGYTADDIIVFLDSDVVSEFFGVHFLCGLAGAVLEGADFSKASFWRAMGRVKKYVAQPLFSVINHELLDDLHKLAYPLSGEVAGTVSFFSKVSFWQMYGVETGINVDACINNFKVADVNLGRYDHEHSGDLGIQKMAFGIIRTYLKKLEEAGLIELKKGARISNVFKASYIDEECMRETIEADLTELRYEPLYTVLTELEQSIDTVQK